MSNDELARVKRIGRARENDVQAQIADLRAQNAELLAERESLKKSLRIAELKTANSLANNLCPDHRDKQVGKPCLACTIETRDRQNTEMLAALRLAVRDIEDDEGLRKATRAAMRAVIAKTEGKS